MTVVQRYTQHSSRAARATACHVLIRVCSKPLHPAWHACANIAHCPHKKGAAGVHPPTSPSPSGPHHLGRQPPPSCDVNATQHAPAMLKMAEQARGDVEKSPQHPREARAPTRTRTHACTHDTHHQTNKCHVCVCVLRPCVICSSSSRQAEPTPQCCPTQQARGGGKGAEGEGSGLCGAPLLKPSRVQQALAAASTGVCHTFQL